MRFARSAVRPAGVVLTLVVLLLVSSVSVGRGAADGSLAGSQGYDTRLPSTDTETTVRGRGVFADLAITVNQTGNLNNQAVSISWTGAEATSNAPFSFNDNFMQVMQCWGEDDGTVPTNPGPPPEQCVFGAAAAKYGGGIAGMPPGLSSSRIIARTDWANYDPSVGVTDRSTTNVWRAFRSVTGDEVGIHIDPTFNPGVAGGSGYWLNSFFNIITTNELPAVPTRDDGTGEALFEVQTGLESTGLGCGQRSLEQSDGSKVVPKCWIVVVPRGAATIENDGSAFEDFAEGYGVSTSPLSPSAWANRIAIPIEFNPVDSPCVIGEDERRLVGTELALRAIVSWQPKLCLQGGLPPYSFATASDETARQQLLSGGFGAPRMVTVSRPIPSDQVDPANPIVYSPLAISGLTIGFTIDRVPRPTAGPEFEPFRGQRVARINLTPRLVAKLLTQSYTGAVTFASYAPSYAWLTGNPAHLGLDPDFIQFNPEFASLAQTDPRTFSGLQLPAGNSDAAAQLWRWILSDPEALEWMEGTPDPWGMKVNPAYSADAATNSLGVAFGTPTPNGFPKAEPFCYQSGGIGDRGSVIPPALCGTDWMPYSRGFYDAARAARTGYDGAKIELNPFAVSSTSAWKTVAPQGNGFKAMLSVTDTPSALQFGVQMASLSRAGDDGADRVFVSPTDDALLLGVASMAPVAEPTVLEPTAASLPAGAYPLTTVTYAASTPVQMSAQERLDFAAFLTFVTGDGQRSGQDVGELPLGYVPLPSSLRAAAAVAIDKVRTVQGAPATTTTEPSYWPGGDAGYGASDDTVAPDTASTTTTVVSAPSTTVPAEPPSTSVPTASVTPPTSVGGGRYAVAGLAAVAFGSAVVSLQITKRPRRLQRITLIDHSDGSTR